MDEFQYKQYTSGQLDAIKRKEKADELNDRLSKFRTVSTLKEAKNLAAEILPTNQELTVFYSGEAKCIVVNKPDMLRITIETNKKILCYNFE